MRIRTDDEIYRVDAVWLGPPKAAFPFRARYVSWALSLPIFFLIGVIQRQVGIEIGFFSIAWDLVLTAGLTKLISDKIGHERPLRSVFIMWAQELKTPRERTNSESGAVSVQKVKMRAERPLPRVRRSKGNSSRASAVTKVKQQPKVRSRKNQNQQMVWR